MNKYEIIENFLEPIPFSDIKNTINGDTFYWFYNDYVNWRPSIHFQFKNEILKDSNLVNHNFLNYLTMCKPMLDKIPLQKIHSLNFNLLPQKQIKTEYKITRYKEKLAILFSNNSDGGINIDKQFIKCSENKLIKLDIDNNLEFVFPVKEKNTTFVLLNYN